MKMRNKLISTPPISGFPYKQQFCRYCEREIFPERVIHQLNKEHYKAIYVCKNTNCGAFDEPAKKAYVKEYYSSNQAFKMLQIIPIDIPDVLGGPKSWGREIKD